MEIKQTKPHNTIVMHGHHFGRYWVIERNILKKEDERQDWFCAYIQITEEELDLFPTSNNISNIELDVFGGISYQGTRPAHDGEHLYIGWDYMLDFEGRNEHDISEEVRKAIDEYENKLESICMEKYKKCFHIANKGTKDEIYIITDVHNDEIISILKRGIFNKYHKDATESYIVCDECDKILKNEDFYNEGDFLFEDHYVCNDCLKKNVEEYIDFHICNNTNDITTVKEQVVSEDDLKNQRFSLQLTIYAPERDTYQDIKEYLKRLDLDKIEFIITDRYQGGMGVHKYKLYTRRKDED